MLKYLKIFSWFLFTFGIVGAGAVAFGVDVGIGTGSGALVAMVLQVLVAAAVMYGFKLHAAGKLSEQALLYGGWGALVALVIIGQVVINVA